MRPPSIGLVLAALALAGCARGSAVPEPPTPPPASRSEPARADPDDYRIYRADGTSASLADIAEASAAVSVVLVGEEHDDSIGHLLEAELLAAAHQRAGARPVVLSLEMFERDVQLVVDEYLGGLINEASFLGAARPWPAYRTAYRPMVEYARARRLPVIAANAPRRYVNMVSRLGLESLGTLAPTVADWLPALPLPEPSTRYRTLFDSLMGGSASHQSAPTRIFDGQRLWDAGMAAAVAAALQARPGALVLHYTGSFHVERRLGMAEALLHYRPGTKLIVVAIRKARTPAEFDARHGSLGDFVILTRRPT